MAGESEILLLRVLLDLLRRRQTELRTAQRGCSIVMLLVGVNVRSLSREQNEWRYNHPPP